MADVIPVHLVIWNEKAKMHLNEYKYDYRMNHGNSEISKIKKMAAFWNLNIDFSCIFRFLGGKKKKEKEKKTADFEIRGSKIFKFQVNRSTKTWDIPSTSLKRMDLRKTHLKFFVTHCIEIFTLTINRVVRKIKYYKIITI